MPGIAKMAAVDGFPRLAGADATILERWMRTRDDVEASAQHIAQPRFQGFRCRGCSESGRFARLQLYGMKCRTGNCPDRLHIGETQ